MFFKQMTGSPDLQLWLDATSEATIEKASLPGQLSVNVSKWTSRDVTGRELTRDGELMDYPVFHPQDGSSLPSIEFDFNKTLKIDRPLKKIGTVISVHKYKSTVNMPGYECFNVLLYYYLLRKSSYLTNNYILFIHVNQSTNGQFLYLDVIK